MIGIYWLSSTSTGSIITSQYRSYLVVVVGGSTWICQPGSVPVLATNQPAPSTTLINSTHLVGMADVNGEVFIVDGSSTIYKVIASTQSMGTYTASTGTAPTYCNIACNWRGRLVLAGDAQNPQNVYFSRLNNPYDWDYSQTDPASAFAANLSKSGQIGEPVIALLPNGDDSMLIGCIHSIWMMQGDPADGGSIVNVSKDLGILGPRAWTTDPSGLLYFVGSGGLYSVRPMWEKYQPPDNLAVGTFLRYFSQLGWETQDVGLVYDSDLHYLYVFVTPTNSTSTGTHIVYDARQGGLWPQRVPTIVGPTVALAFQGQNSPNSRALLLGGWDGYIRLMDQSAYDDDGSTVSASLTFGPFRPSPNQTVLAATTVNFGELFTGDTSTRWNADVLLNGGPNAYSVTEGTPRHSTFINCTLDQRQKTMRQRLQGEWYTLGLRNSTDGKYFSFESAIMEVEPAGRNRERR